MADPVRALAAEMARRGARGLEESKGGTGVLVDVRDIALVETPQGPAIAFKGGPADFSARKLRFVPETGLLERFVSLADATPEAVLAFTQAYGVFDVCPHEQHWIHRAHEASSRCTRLLNPQPVGLYRRYAAVARATLLLAAEAVDGRRGDPDAWTLLNEFLVDQVPLWRVADRPHPFPRAVREAVASSFICFWWRLGPQELYLHWGERRREWKGVDLRVGGPSLLSAISRQLAFAVVRADGLAICAGCGAPFARPRASRRTARAWCPRCGLRAAHRQAQRDYRARRATE